jgi:ribose/xylose/arabinose/galactoside ABC-type transport system permease subunit
MRILSPYFLRLNNIINILLQVSFVGTIALGMTFVILLGSIDLSVGSVLGISGIIVAFSASLGNLYLSILVGLVVGAFFGLLNGTISYYLKLQSFIVTLSFMSIARGLAFIFTQGHPVILTIEESQQRVGGGEVTQIFEVIGYGYVGQVPILVIFWLAAVIIFITLLEFTKFGRYVRAIGGNETAAYLSGINVGFIKVTCFMINGMLSGLAGFMMTAYFQAGVPLAGTGFELDAIACVVIGGTALTGGKGSLVGTLLGIIIFGMLSNMFNLLNISAYMQMVAKGVIILAAVYAAARSQKQMLVVK